ALRLKAEAGALAGPAGTTLAANSVQLRLLDYVPAVGHLDPPKKLRRWPDILRDLPADGFEVPPREDRCLWLTVRVPADAVPGVYSGAITLTEAEGGKLTLPVQLTVHDVLLPTLSQGDFRVDFWQDFGALARQYAVAQWSDEWWALAKTFLQDLADHGQSVVQVGRGHFDWTLDASGEWRFGFERFDRYVALCDSVGIHGLIEYLQMFDGRGDTWLYYTDSLGKAQKVKANPGDPLFDEVWLAFGKALAAHCREKDWLLRLYVCPTDEPQDVYSQPTLHRFKHCSELLKQADAAHRTTVALDSLKSARDLAPSIDRFVFKLREDTYDPKLAADLREAGKLVETYICCHPDLPNSFITSEAIEQRALGWICWQERFQGLLRWSYVNWPKDVWNKPEGDGAYAPGDLFIVYPGDQRPLASARWERMREGFEDWQMLQAVQRRIMKAPSGAKRDAAQKTYDEAITAVAGPRGKLTAYTRDPQVFLEARRKLLEAADQL
ncbi:MAG: glycoside hydrolase domain-containing protein, partial [Armatimonadota bacterium]